MPGGLSILLIYQSVFSDSHMFPHSPKQDYYVPENCSIYIVSYKHRKNKTENTTYMFKNLTRRYAPKSFPVMLIDSDYPVPRYPWRLEAISDTRIQALNVAMNQKLAGGGTVYGTVLSRPLKPEGFHRLTCMIDSSHLRAQAV